MSDTASDGSRSARRTRAGRYQVVDVIAVRHRLVTAALAVDMILAVAAAAMLWHAAIGMLVVSPENVLVDVTLMRMVQVTVVATSSRRSRSAPTPS